MKKKTSNYLLLASGIVSFIISLYYFIQSIEVYADEWGTDISSNNDYVVALLVSLIVIVYALYKMFSKEFNKTLTPVFAFTSTGIVSLYDLGVFFKAMNKGKEFLAYQSYLFIGITLLLVTAYFVFKYLETKKDN